jgi:RNA polymerase sigma factor (TIGR02999 family)
MSDVTRILQKIETGDSLAAAELMPLVYEELRKLAAARLAQEKSGQTLEATALVHEAYVRLIGGSGQEPTWDNRGHFFAAAAEAMRRILVDAARRKKAGVRGGKMQKQELELDQIAISESPLDILALDQALEELALESPSRAELVKLRFFAGLTNVEAAKILGVSEATAERYWTFSRTWLFKRLRS